MEYSSKSVSLYTTIGQQLVQGDSLASLIQPHGSFSSLFKAENGVWWLHCTDPSEDEIRALSAALKLHPLTEEDIVGREVKEKFEDFGSYFFVAYGLMNSAHFYAITTNYGILTIQCGAAEPDFTTQLSRIKILQDTVGADAVSPDLICYAFIDSTTDSFGPKITQVENEASVIERELFQHNGKSDVRALLHRMCHARNQSIELMYLFQGKPSVLHALSNHCNEGFSKDHPGPLFLSAAHAHLREMRENIYDLENILTRSFVNYISIMRVNMVHSNTSMEQIVGGVSLVGLSLIPSHLVTSAWAMNVPVPGKDHKGEGWFWGVVGLYILLTIISAIAAYWYYVRIIATTRMDKFVSVKRA